MERVGIFVPNWVGDVVMSTPTLRAVREHYASAHIVGVMRPYVQHVLQGTRWLDETVFLDPGSVDRKQRCLSALRQLRKRQLDLILLLTNSLRSAAVAWLSGARERVGYVRYGRGPLLTGRLPPPRDGRRLAPVSAVDYYLQIAKYVGADIRSKQTELCTTAEDERLADMIWGKLGWQADDPVVALNTGGAYGAAKRWPNHYFADLSRRIVSAVDVRVLILCGPAEREAAAEIERQARHPRVKSLAGEPLGIGLTKACVRRSRLLVTTDSGPRHFAAAFDVPVVSLFGPTDPRWSHNYARRAIDMHIDLPCRPCARRTCPLGHHLCMYELTPERVQQCALHMLL
jgi:heptosyltransferase-2